MERLCTVRFLSAVRAGAASAPVPSAQAYPKMMCSALGELQRREQRKETTAHDLALSYGRREVRRGKEQW